MEKTITERFVLGLFRWGKQHRRDMPFFPTVFSCGDGAATRGNPHLEKGFFLFNINNLWMIL